MRIAFVTPYFYPALGYGGTPRLAYEMARALAHRGHQVTVFTTDAGGERRLARDVIEDIETRKLDGVRVFFYKNLSNSLAYRQRLFLPVRFFREVSTAVAGNQVIHVHDVRSFLSVASHRAARMLRIPYVLSPHGGLPHLGKKSAKVIFDGLWGNAILRDTAALCAISPLEENDARMLGVETARICPFPPAINPHDYCSLPAPGTFSAQWGLENRRIVLFLGRLHWIKGVDVLIEALRVLPDMADLHLVIAGPDDSAGAQLRSLVKAKGLERKVTFTGLLDDAAKLAALVDSKVVVLPSRREGFPLAVLEALACRTPVILTSACELGNGIEQQPGLIRFCSGDPDDLAQKIKTTVCRPPEPETMLEARNFILNNFSLDSLAERAERLYRSLV